MAFRRGLTIRATLITRRLNPSISYISHDDDDCKRQPSRASSSPPAITNFLQREYCNGLIDTATPGFGALFRERGSRFPCTLGLGSSFCSYSSSTIGEGSEKIMTDVAEVLSDNDVEVAVSQAEVVNEVAIAAADSFLPVQFLQHLIDGVHSFTGLNWWVAIALTSIMIRMATVPLLVNQLKCTTKLTLMRPRLEEIKLQMNDKGRDPESVAEGQKRMQELFREYGVTPFSPLKGLFIQGPIFFSFYLAITNMVEKVPSLKEGGAFWFTDLTTPDSLYIFPVLTALSFLITVECNMQEGLEGNPVASTIKNFSRVFAVLTVPLTMSFPKAIFCYWITSSLFSLMYGLAIKSPQVRDFLRVPKIPVSSTSAPNRAHALFSSASREHESSSISQKLIDLEVQVKARNKDDKI